jgi:CubicO group peptidase (beta-lactamase class C family)
VNKLKIGIISRRNILTMIAVLFFSISCPAQDIATKANEYLNAQTKLGAFSGSVLIAQGGKVLLSKGYGMANLELDVPNIPQTKFRLGSVTKQFTAMAIMQLQERGLLDVNDPIIKYIPDYPNGEKITIHHLLTHTSGIPNLTDFPDFLETVTLPSPVEKTIERFKNKPLDFEPGEKFNYSNSGYVLLGYLIEKISGKSYEDFLKENIFQPLNMNGSGYDHSSTILKNRASGYSLGTDGLVNADYINMSLPLGGGCLYSTVEDLYLWDRALYTDKLVSQSSLKEIFTPFKEDYGYGWFVSELFKHKRINHSGGIQGFSCNISRYPDDDLCIIALSNYEHAVIGKIAKDLTAIAFGEKYELPQEKKVAEIDYRICNAYVGRYQLDTNFVIEITREGNHLFGQGTGQPKFELFPESETKFFLKIIDAQISFVKDDQGKVTEMVLHQSGKDHPAKKIE